LLKILQTPVPSPQKKHKNSDLEVWLKQNTCPEFKLQYCLPSQKRNLNILYCFWGFLNLKANWQLAGGECGPNSITKFPTVLKNYDLWYHSFCLHNKVLLKSIEPNLEATQNAKHWFTIWSSNTTLGDRPQRLWHRLLQRHLHTHVYYGTIHNSQVMETAKMPQHWRMD
jgi:hypothetical protein